MYCPNCRTLNNTNDSFCKNCGTPLIGSVQNSQVYNNVNNSQPISGYQTQTTNQPGAYGYTNQLIDYSNQTQSANNYSQNYYDMGSYQPQQTNPAVNNTNYNYYDQFQNPTVNNNDDLVDAYISKNVDKIKNNSFSVPTFFFGAAYMFYRKNWGMGFLYILLSLVFLSVPFGWIILPIIFALKFNKSYVEKVRDRVSQIASDNLGTSREELKKICSQKGGTTIVPVILIILFWLVLIFLIITPIVLDVLDDSANSVARSEASMIVSQVNNYCTAADMQHQLKGTTNICADGVSVNEVYDIVDLTDTEVISIKYKNGNVVYLKIEYNEKVVEYDGSYYEILD